MKDSFGFVNHIIQLVWGYLGYFCWNLIFFWQTKLPSDIYYNYWFAWHFNFSQYLLPELLLFQIFFFFFTGQWETKDYESPTHNSDIIINYFVFIFQCVLMFYHFWFIRLLNTSNCFIITFSLNDFIHELTFLLKDAIWDKYLVRSKRASWEC